jgi:hypothetical protein
MNDLISKIEQLGEAERDYVFARSEVSTDTAGYRNAGIGKTRFYSWPADVRENLNILALELKTQTALKARLLLADATERAAEVKISGLDSRKEHIKQAVSTEILDRMIGKPKQMMDVTSGGKPINLSALTDEQLEQLEDILRSATDTGSDTD